MIKTNGTKTHYNSTMALRIPDFWREFCPTIEAIRPMFSSLCNFSWLYTIARMLIIHCDCLMKVTSIAIPAIMMQMENQ